ncbi:hypothetical protein [Nakamurella lactea]|jgi:hypothetical protein|uniref:hypothetical protein n=1 Tax=Nakamurella lactea TaxID=459515 RepID=UPI000403BCBA|nr:hypothetical protein [Nakamurella lactea]
MALFGISVRRRRDRPSDAVRGALDPEELVMGRAVSVDGTELAVTRRRLLVLPVGQQPVRSLPWYRVAKVTLRDATLTVVGLEVVGELPGGGEIVRDATPDAFSLAAPARLTDQVHARVRRSVVASRHLPWPGGGGWVTLRRVAGRDGVLLQLRLDPGARPDNPGLTAAAEQVGAELSGQEPTDATGVDD